MNTHFSEAPGRAALIAGWVLSGLLIAFLLFDAGIKLVPLQVVLDTSKELGLPSGPAYFVNIRALVAEHTDSKTYGPLSAAVWLARLDTWRAAVRHAYDDFLHAHFGGAVDERFHAHQH